MKLFEEIRYEDYLAISLSNEIQNILPTYNRLCEKLKSMKDFTCQIDKSQITLKSKIKSSSSGSRYVIYVLQDEWFYVEYNKYWYYTEYNKNTFDPSDNKYYKCDQEEGLLELLGYNYIKESNKYLQNDYYKEITQEEYNSYENIERFNPIETDRIKKVIKENPNLKEIDSLAIFTIVSGFNQYYLYKIPDEWYLISAYETQGDKFYKCDQIEGVLKFIKDNL